ncbi:hypothetical protein ACLOJK_014067 [Asimina triloba]
MASGPHGSILFHGLRCPNASSIVTRSLLSCSSPSTAKENGSVEGATRGIDRIQSKPTSKSKYLLSSAQQNIQLQKEPGIPKKRSRDYEEDHRRSSNYSSSMMAAASHAMISANTCALSGPGHRFLKTYRRARPWTASPFSVRASSDETDCNTEECAPEKEVGTVSVEWLAGEKTKVVGTFPPRRRGWTGYVEKDTAGQTNIYSVEPAVYVAESAISSGTAGTSSEGAENTVAIAAGLALISIAAASSILLLVGKNSLPQVRTADYSGPSLSYYINKFKPSESIQASVPVEPQTPPVILSESDAPSVPQVPVIQEAN